MGSYSESSIMTNQSLEPLSQLVTSGIQNAVAQALDRHRRLGESVVVILGDVIVTLKPEEIQSMPTS